MNDAQPEPGDLVIAERASEQKKHGFALYQRGEVLKFEGVTPMHDPDRVRWDVWSQRRGKSLEVWAANFKLHRRRGA